MQIRFALPTDAAAIAEIYNEAVLNTVATFDTELKDSHERLRWLEAHGESHPVLVAEVEGCVVGWASLTRWSDRKAYDLCAETSFYVLSSHQGRGIGRALLAALLAESRRLGFHSLLARIASDSVESVHLHAKFGFTEIGTLREVGQKFDRWLDVIIMQILLAENAPDGKESSTAPGAAATASAAGH